MGHRCVLNLKDPARLFSGTIIVTYFSTVFEGNAHFFLPSPACYTKHLHSCKCGYCDENKVIFCFYVICVSAHVCIFFSHLNLLFCELPTH